MPTTSLRRRKRQRMLSIALVASPLALYGLEAQATCTTTGTTTTCDATVSNNATSGCVLKESLDQECTPASTALENLAVALSTASTDAVMMFGCFPTPKREPGTPGNTASTIATAKASAPVLRLRSS